MLLWTSKSILAMVDSVWIIIMDWIIVSQGAPGAWWIARYLHNSCEWTNTISVYWLLFYLLLCILHRDIPRCVIYMAGIHVWIITNRQSRMSCIINCLPKANLLRIVIMNALIRWVNIFKNSLRIPLNDMYCNWNWTTKMYTKRFFDMHDKTSHMSNRWCGNSWWLLPIP